MMKAANFIDIVAFVYLYIVWPLSSIWFFLGHFLMDPGWNNE